MEVLEAARTMNLPDPRVWVVGDWHGNVGWVQRLLPALGRIDRQIETLTRPGMSGERIAGVSRLS